MKAVIKAVRLEKRFRITDADIKSSLSYFFNIKSTILRKREIKALDNVSFDVHEGDSLGLIGPNGSGKTTLLRVLAGILSPNKGKLKVMKTPTPVLQLGSGFQNELTARENILLYGNLLGIKNSVMEKRVQSILDYAELKDYENIKLKYFSSGMYNRLAFAIMTDTKPDLLLLDEIFAVGDIYFKDKSGKYIKEFLKEGKTLVIASHDIPMIKAMTNKCIYLDKGKIVAMGKTEQVVNRYMEDFRKSD